MKMGVKVTSLAALWLTLGISPLARGTPNFYAAGADNSEIGDRIPLILVHGILEDASIWNNFLNYYNTAPALQDDFKPYVFEYKTRDSELGAGDPQNVSGLGQALGAYLAQWYASPTAGPTYGFNGKPVVILAHSMGGLVARSMMTYYLFGAGVTGIDKVSMLITLATPHHGTPLGNEYMDAYPVAQYFVGLYPGFAYNMEWDCYDGIRFSGECGLGIPSSAYYSKIFAYGAQLTPPGPDSTLNTGHWVLCQDGYCTSDGAVPIESALFYPNPVQMRYVDGSCDHDEIYNGTKTVDGGFPIFASVREDLLTLISVALPPAIVKVSPSTLTGLPLPQTQLLHIYGSGFTSSSTLLFNGSIASDPTRLYFISANEIDYYIRTDTNAANWTVQVINGSQQSNLGTFTVVAPPPPSAGSLTVTLQPAGAVSAGAQWQVDGGVYHSSGDVVTGLTPGLHAISCKGIAGYTAPASHSVSITGAVVASDTETYSVVTPNSYTLTLNNGGSMGYIAPAPFGTWNGSAYVYSAGAVVQLAASANPGYHFVGWGGDLSGTANPVIITMSGNKSMTANFASGDPNMGTVIVTIQPPAAAAAGVTWGFNASDYRASGSSCTTWPEPYILTLHPVDGWLGPSGLVATITAGQTSNYVATFTADTTPGLLTVTLTPPNAVTAGAKWHANGAAQGSGTTAALPPGTYTVTYDSIPGWTPPQAQTVQVIRSQTAVLTGNYTPPVGQPLITAIQPSFGSLAGGTPVTIEGINFTAPVTVWIGGIPATNVNVLSPSQITCFTPANSVYGTQPVVVQSSGGSTTNLSGFAYGLPRGSGIGLAGSIGGNVSAVASQGNYCYIGEGSTFTVLDVSNPSAPSPIGHLAMPGLVQDVVLFTNSGRQYAAVADDDAGLQIVDVTTAAAPALRGYYNTGDEVLGVAVFGTNAYVANGNSGFMGFDISNPIQPRLVGSLATGYSDKLAVQASPSNVFAYVSAGGALAVVDVSTPSNPVLRGQTSAITTRWAPHSLAVSGNRAFLADAYDDLQPIDITDPNSPTPLGSVSNNSPSAITITDGRLYTSGPSGLIVYNLVSGSLTQIGYLYSNLLIQGNNMVVVGGFALCGSGQNGVAIFDVSTPSNPIYYGVI